MRTTVVVHFDTHEDHWGGYVPGHPLAEVFTYDTAVSADPLEIAEDASRMFNAPPEILDEVQRTIASAYRSQRIRSLSVGDVLRVGEVWLACERAGFAEIEPPAAEKITTSA
jgi:hypothetical protein